jgi:hypothetical protein
VLCESCRAIVFAIQYDEFCPSKIASKILAHSTELGMEIQKSWQKDWFFVDKKETSDHL